MNLSYENDECIDALIIHYNNPSALTATVESIVQKVTKNITIFDNSDARHHQMHAEEIARAFDLTYFKPRHNLGWGASINLWASAQDRLRPVIMIAAHDAKIEQFDRDNVLNCLSQEGVFSVSPGNCRNTDCKYSYSRFFYFVPSQKLTAGRHREEQVGHSTAIIFRSQHVQRLLFDEEFFIYGCESEIFLRAADEGLTTFRHGDFEVQNPGTDS